MMYSTAASMAPDTTQKSTSESALAAVDRIPLGQLAAYGAGGIIPIALFNIAGILVGLMGNISLGLSAFWLGVILIVPRLWDAVADPVIGHLSDNTRTRWGRRRPYLLVGGILTAVFFVVMWWIPKGDTVRSWFPTESSYHWFQLGYILLALTLFFTSVTIFEIPHSALGAEMSTDSHQRTRLFSAKSFVGNLFAMSTPWLFVLANMERFKGPRGNEADGMRYVSLIICAILVPLSFWWFFTLREPGFAKAAQREATPFWHDMKRTIRNTNFVRLTLTIFTLAMGFNFVQLLGSYIPIFYVFGGDKAAGARLLGINGTIWAVTGLLAVFPLNWISPRLGKRNTLVVAILLIALAQLSKVVCYNPLHPYLIVIPTMLLSCGMLFFFTLGSSMVGDICDEDELQTGYRAEGSYYSVFWWFIKMGTALASLISGALIVLTMFDETQVTKVDKLQGGVRELRAKVEAFRAHESRGSSAVGSINDALAESAERAKLDAAELLSHLQAKSAGASESSEHYRSLARATEEIERKLSSIGASPRLDALDAELVTVEATLGQLTKQPPYTLLMMRAVEIGLPLLACLFSLLCVLGYALTETRNREIKDLLARRHAEQDTHPDPAVV
jgi:GPH family glycoside/pentoside/hexuronide:cation symporter